MGRAFQMQETERAETARFPRWGTHRRTEVAGAWRSLGQKLGVGDNQMRRGTWSSSPASFHKRISFLISFIVLNSIGYLVLRL